MAVFIARLGVTAAAGHQIAANLAAMMFMAPLALASATMTLVAQRVGARDSADAQRLAWHGLRFAGVLALGMALALGLAREAVAALYTADLAVRAVAVPLLTWVALFHFADAVQAVSSFVLRAYRIATLPMLIYAGSLWGVGLGGGWWLVFVGWAGAPAAWRGPEGYWVSAAAGLWLAAFALAALLAYTLAQQAREPLRPAAGAD
jgi:MATE family multidrug resistance protein